MLVCICIVSVYALTVCAVTSLTERISLMQHVVKKFYKVFRVTKYVLEWSTASHETLNLQAAMSIFRNHVVMQWLIHPIANPIFI